jgi:hypothetical protein
MEKQRGVFVSIQRVDGAIIMRAPTIDLTGVKVFDIFCTDNNVPGDVFSGELNVPDSVKELFLSGCMIDGIPVAPVLKFGGNLIEFGGCSISFESVKAYCSQSPRLFRLFLRDIPGFDTNGMDG